MSSPSARSTARSSRIQQLRLRPRRPRPGGGPDEASSGIIAPTFLRNEPSAPSLVRLSGTSMASAIVAGVAAYTISSLRDVTNDQVLSAMRTSAGNTSGLGDTDSGVRAVDASVTLAVASDAVTAPDDVWQLDLFLDELVCHRQRPHRIRPNEIQLLQRRRLLGRRVLSPTARDSPRNSLPADHPTSPATIERSTHISSPTHSNHSRCRALISR